jgi:hypothetical protein
MYQKTVALIFNIIWRGIVIYEEIFTRKIIQPLYKSHSFQLWNTKLAYSELSGPVLIITTFTAEVVIESYEIHSATSTLLILYKGVLHSELSRDYIG